MTFGETLCTNLEPVTFGVVGRMSRPVVSPDAFNGEGSFSDWIDHFEGVASLNKWSDEDKLLWLRIRLTGRAQTAYKQLKAEVRGGTYDNIVKALRQRFEPESRRELYAAEFQTRRKKKTESWADFGDDLCALADRAFPDLGNDGKQQIALLHFLANLSSPQVAFGVRQRKPKTVEEAVTATLELESYLTPSSGPGRVAQVEVEEPSAQEAIVAAVKSQQDAMLDLMSKLVERLEKLEAQDSDPGDQTADRRSFRQAGGRGGRESKKVYCHNCGQEGHFRRGCAKPKQQGNGNPSV